MRSRVLVLIVLLVASAFPLVAQSQARYADVEVAAFEAAKGVDFPPDFQAALMDELVRQFTETKKFAKVMREGETAADAPAPVLKVTGEVTSVDEGSQAARMFVGFGAGKARIQAHVKFVDAKSGEVQFESDVKASMSGGWVGGKAVGVAKNLAKAITKLAKQHQF